ncbi:MAG: hypothetical protein HQK81_00410 [Desulfovibrionaceae bacterium]|nr:hypothetical protein [Desulfovibrionaceae bacterium]MBF0512509.1 hypothetical protein [Desulfovibrionaceae bacterium]
MHDDRGLFYYPAPSEKKIRMYVRENAGEIEFRLFNQEHPEIWERHGWTPASAVKQAAALYRRDNPDKNPLTLYDENAAAFLLREGK